jgi:hypothetical protein
LNITFLKICPPPHRGIVGRRQLGLKIWKQEQEKMGKLKEKERKRKDTRKVEVKKV